MAATRPIDLLYFAALRERMGLAAERIPLPDTVDTVRQLAAFLEASRPALRGVLGSVRFAVGDEFVSLERKLMPGDVVALIPPVSGG
ncbi:MAG TPA: molybdopterin converting factor subunit 1 [Polyangiaceae bacterium]|nr:molybdopterin converting factor subunit 1 [Polyangiaceae bacterium]